MSANMAMMDPVHSAMKLYGNSHGPDGASSTFSQFYKGHQDRSSSYNIEPRLEDNFHAQDLKSVVYVGSLTRNIDEEALREVFSNFGTVISIVRRPLIFDDDCYPNERSYAFVRFSSPHEAQYAVQVGEVEIHGQKIIIRPRENRTRSIRFERQTLSRGPESSKYTDEGREKHFSMVSHKTQGNSDERTVECHENGVRHFKSASNQQASLSGYIGPVLMSKALCVANLPSDMTPKEFYYFLSQVGSCDGCFIFAHLDEQGRRFGHAVMSTFFLAQKAVETFHTLNYRGSTLEVTYHTEPVPTAIYNNQELQFPQCSQNSEQAFLPTYTPTQWSQMIHTNTGTPNGAYGTIPPQAFMFNPLSGISYAGISNEQVYPTTNRSLSAFTSQLISPHIKGTSRMPSYPRSHEDGRNQRRTSPFQSGDLNESSNCSPGGAPGVASGRQRTPLSPSQVYIHEGDVFGGIPANNYNYNVLPERNSLPYQMMKVENNLTSKTQTGFEVVPSTFIPETTKPVDPCNLFVKNLDDKIIGTSEDLKKIFEKYGTVTSAHLATLPGTVVSKGYGFVAFGKQEEAAKAKELINNSLLGKKRVFVSYAERKEDRSKRLQSLFGGSTGDIKINENNRSRDNSSSGLGKNEGNYDVKAQIDINESSPKASLEAYVNIDKITPPKLEIEPAAEAGKKVKENISSENHEIEKKSQDKSIQLAITLPIDKENHNLTGSLGMLAETANHKDIAIATTLASVKGWPSTTLSKILEVDEEGTQGSEATSDKDILSTTTTVLGSQGSQGSQDSHKLQNLKENLESIQNFGGDATKGKTTQTSNPSEVFLVLKDVPIKTQYRSVEKERNTKVIPQNRGNDSQGQKGGNGTNQGQSTNVKKRRNHTKNNRAQGTGTVEVQESKVTGQIGIPVTAH